MGWEGISTFRDPRSLGSERRRRAGYIIGHMIAGDRKKLKN